MAAQPRVQDGIPDLAEQVVAVNFDDDANYRWHGRVLLERLGDQGLWICLTPDGEVQVIRLADHQVVALRYGDRLPARLAGDYYGFPAIDEDDLAVAHRDARALSAVLGPAPAAAAPAPRAASWYFSDTAHEKFGTQVPDAALVAGNMVQRGSVGLINFDDGDGAEWTTMERVAERDKPDWMAEKQSGPGRDERVSPIVRDVAGARSTDLREAMTQLRPWPTAAGPPADWCFRGPSAVTEVLNGVRAAGEDLAGYHDFYLRASGLHPESATAIKHRDMVSLLHHFVEWDMLNAPRCATAELICRFILQIQQAVKRNPKCPDFRGTSVMTMSKLDSGGGLLVGEFAKFVAEEQKTEAFTMKQARLHAEEVEKDQGRGGQGGGGGGNPGGGKPGGGKSRAGAKAGAGGSSGSSGG